MRPSGPASASRPATRSWRPRSRRSNSASPLADQWSRHLFVALLRRYGIYPYRYRGQRRTTVMARLSRAFVNETLWPEFMELQGSLAAYFDALTDRVI